MPSVASVIDLLEAVSRRDMMALRQAGKAMADEELRKGHLVAAQRIEDAVEVASSSDGYDFVCEAE